MKTIEEKLESILIEVCAGYNITNLEGAYSADVEMWQDLLRAGYEAALGELRLEQERKPMETIEKIVENIFAKFCADNDIDPQFEYSGHVKTWKACIRAGYEAAQPKWVSAHDELPKLGKGILMRLDKNKASCPWALGYLEEEDGWMTWRDFDDDEIDSDFVVAWMYLPEFKEGEE